jgi:methionyl-tRNA formyltransferase
MRIIFMGTPAFACPALIALANSRHEIATVVTGQDKPTGRGKKTASTEVARLAESLNLPILKPASLKDSDLFESLAKLEADLIVVIAFRILPKNLFDLPRLGSINIHGSLLPKYRGAAPINWALINGEKETGLSAFYLKKKVDTGDIISQEKISIENNDNFDRLYQKLADLAGPFLIETLDRIENRQTDPIPQDDNSSSKAPKITAYDALIDFGFPADIVTSFVRGMSSKPGAYTFFRGKKLKIIACQPIEGNNQPNTRPGTITCDKKQLMIQCADSTVELLTVIPEGKKEMDGSSFINGFRPQKGELMGEIPDRSKITQ